MGYRVTAQVSGANFLNFMALLRAFLTLRPTLALPPLAYVSGAYFVYQLTLSGSLTNVIAQVSGVSFSQFHGIFDAKAHFSPAHFGPAHFGPAHFDPAHFGPAHLDLVYLGPILFTNLLCQDH